MSQAIVTDNDKAQRLLIGLVPNEQDRKRLLSGGKAQERVSVLKQLIEIFILQGLPTAVIARTLNLGQGAIQYHARWLERKGKIIRPSKTAHWIWAKENGEN